MLTQRRNVSATSRLNATCAPGAHASRGWRTRLRRSGLPQDTPRRRRALHVGARGSARLWVVRKRVTGVLRSGRRGCLLLQHGLRLRAGPQRRRQRVPRHKAAVAPGRRPQVARAAAAHDALIKGDAACAHFPAAAGASCGAGRAAQHPPARKGTVQPQRSAACTTVTPGDRLGRANTAK